MRHENKCLFEPDYYDELCFRILASSFFFSEIYPRRQVNNIYLDSVDLKNYHDNINGELFRSKHRIRWYGEGLDASSPVLEYKIKCGGVGYKQSLALPSFALGGFDFDDYLEQINRHAQLHDHLGRIMFDEIFMEAPTLLNSYSRRYFLSDDEKYRITIDKHICYHSISKRFQPTYSFEDCSVVLELKYEDDDRTGAHRVVQQLGSRVTRKSKYVTGINGIYFNSFEG